MGGVDVTSQCLWQVTCSHELGLFQYPGFATNGLLKPNAAAPGDTLVIKASIYESGGSTRIATKSLSVVAGGGLSFAISPVVAYLGVAGNQFDWDVTANATGFTANQAGTSFEWYLDGVPQGSTKTVHWVRHGMPTVAKFRLVVTDGQGHSGEQIVAVDFQSRAPGEPGQRYAAWQKRGVTFLNSRGEPTEPDPARKNNGLIILTHGLEGYPFDSWIQNLAAHIENRLAGVSGPNVVIFGWADDANPSKLYGTTPERLTSVAGVMGLSAETLRTIFPDSTGYSDFLFKVFMIRGAAENQGRTSLANWIREEEGLGNISKSAPIQFIGHSAGGFVIGECNKELAGQGFNIRRVTMLDTPFVEKQHVNAGNPAVIERYVSSLFGKVCPSIDLQVRWSTSRGLYFEEKQDSTLYHRLDVGWGGNIDQVAAHGYSHAWYDSTVASYPMTEGFQLSPFITGTAAAPVTSNGPQNFPLSIKDASLATQNVPAPPIGITGFLSFGNVSESVNSYILTEGGNSGIVKNLKLPADASGLTFNYQFTTPGDGDFIVVHFGDSPPLFMASPALSNTEGIASAEISLAQYAGQTGDLVIKLVAQEAVNAVVNVDSIQMTHDDDIDGDGLLAAEEVTAGTDPRFSDTDGDGIDDLTELNTTHTDPVLADSDGDGANDGSELAAGTDPLDGSSRFAVKASLKTGSNFTISWSSVAGKQYRIIRSSVPSFDSFDVVTSGIVALPPQQSFTDAGGATGNSMFYRVELGP